MASIADLSVDLKLLTASFTSNAKKVQQDVAAMRTSFEGVRASAANFQRALGTLGIAVGVKAIADFGLQSLRAAGDLGELAQQLGVSTDSLQAYQFAAKQSGVSSEQLETALARLTQRIGDAAAGNKEAIDAFQALGVGVLDAQGKIRSTDAVLGDVAEALSKIPDPAKRAATEVDLFGRSGQRLDTILAGGRDGLRAYQREAQNTGQILSHELIQQADMAADRIDEMESAWSKLAQTLMAKVAPALTYIAKGLTPQNLTTLDKIETIEGQIRLLEQGGGTMRGTPTAIPLQNLREQLEDLREIQRLQQSLHPYAPPPTFNPPPASTTTAKGSGRAAGADSRAADTEEIRDQTAALQEYVIGLDQERQALALTGAARAQYEALIRASAAAQADYDAGLRASPLLTGEEATAIKANVDALYQMQQAAQATHETVTQGAQDSTIAASALDSSLQTIVNTLAEGAAGAQTWGEVWKSVLMEVIRLVFQLLRAALGGQGGGGGAGGILGSILGGLVGSIFGGGGGGLNSLSGGAALGAFAAGGNPPVGVPSIVGENGPELFVPRTAGTILPNGFQPGGVVVNQVNHYDLRGTDISRSELDQKIRKSQRETYGAVFKGINSGGSESKAVGRRRK